MDLLLHMPVFIYIQVMGEGGQSGLFPFLNRGWRVLDKRVVCVCVRLGGVEMKETGKQSIDRHIFSEMATKGNPWPNSPFHTFTYHKTYEDDSCNDGCSVYNNVYQSLLCLAWLLQESRRGSAHPWPFLFFFTPPLSANIAKPPCLALHTHTVIPQICVSLHTLIVG